MNRELCVLWHEHSCELEVRRPNGQRIIFRTPQLLAGSHQVFEVGVSGQDVWALTGPQHNRRPTRRHYYTQTGLYRGSRAL